MKLRNRVIAVLAGAVVVPAFTATTAQASYPTAYNIRTQKLSATPNTSMPEATVTRPIFLTDGCYDWELWYDGGTYNSRVIYLSYDQYTWLDYLIPENGHYDQRSILEPWSFPDDAFNPTGGDRIDSPPSASASATSWGSSLLWLYAGDSVHQSC